MEEIIIKKRETVCKTYIELAIKFLMMPDAPPNPDETLSNNSPFPSTLARRFYKRNRTYKRYAKTDDQLGATHTFLGFLDFLKSMRPLQAWQNAHERS